MRKFLFVFMFIAGAKTLVGQDTLHDYRTITHFGDKLIISSPDSALRVITYDMGKGEEGPITRDIAAMNARLLQLVQEYEIKGWSLFTVYNASNGPTWILRKPKP